MTDKQFNNLRFWLFLIVLLLCVLNWRVML